MHAWARHVRKQGQTRKAAAPRTKVTEDCIALSCGHDVMGVHIPVADAARVQVLQGAGHPLRHAQHKLQREHVPHRPAAAQERVEVGLLSHGPAGEGAQAQGHRRDGALQGALRPEVWRAAKGALLEETGSVRMGGHGSGVRPCLA